MIDYDVKKMYEWPLLAQAFIIGLISAFIIYMGFLLDLSSLRTDINAQIRQEGNLKEQLRAYLSNRLMVIETVSHVPTLQDKLAQWQKNFIPTSELQHLLDQLLKLGESLHLKFNTFDPQEPTKKDGYTAVAVKLNVMGTYDQIASYISEIANMSKLVSIGNFILYKDEEEKSSAPSAGKQSTDLHQTTGKNLTAILTLEILQR